MAFKKHSLNGEVVLRQNIAFMSMHKIHGKERLLSYQKNLDDHALKILHLLQFLFYDVICDEFIRFGRIS